MSINKVILKPTKSFNVLNWQVWIDQVNLKDVLLALIRYLWNLYLFLFQLPSFLPQASPKSISNCNLTHFLIHSIYAYRIHPSAWHTLNTFIPYYQSTREFYDNCTCNYMNAIISNFLHANVYWSTSINSWYGKNTHKENNDHSYHKPAWVRSQLCRDSWPSGIAALVLASRVWHWKGRSQSHCLCNSSAREKIT